MIGQKAQSMKSKLFLPAIDNTWLYSFVELCKKNKDYMNYYINYYYYWRELWPDSVHNAELLANLDANIGMIERFAKDYGKPEFGIHEIEINDKIYHVTENSVLEKPFCKLLHFKKNSKVKQPKLLIVAPLSGHYATLLRGTVQDSLKYFDVYVTDWVNAREVPLSEGGFDLDNFIDYVKEFIIHLGSDLSIMGVCQPTVPVLAAVSLLEEEGNSNVKNMILTGGPIDARISSTEVTKFAEKRPMHWFESNVISRVPVNYKGFMRPVYPGFIQLGGFLSMNMQRHMGEFMKLYQHLKIGDGESIESHTKFYDEYLSVLDLTGEFYLQTIQTVFKEYDLPQGKMYHRDRKVSPEKIKKSSLLIIEGELDDISGIGQTRAAIDLCPNIKNSHYHLQSNVGHYGVFNGRKFREQILPVIKDFCYTNLES